MDRSHDYPTTDRGEAERLFAEACVLAAAMAMFGHDVEVVIKARGRRCAGNRQVGDERAYHEFLASIADQCECCDVCSPGVCAGVQAGGFCDQMCDCDEDE